MNNAGCAVSSIAPRISLSRLVVPVDVSLWTTQTAFIDFLVSLRNFSSTN